MQKLTVDTSKDPVTSDILFALQLRTANEPLLPKLKTFECEGVTTGAFIHFIPIFLSRKTTEINIIFDEDSDSPTVMIASMITRLPVLCPHLERITLGCLPKDPAIVEAVSDMLLAYNRDTLQWFLVDSPLTEEAREAVSQLPKLSDLWLVIQGHTLLPQVALPNLTMVHFEYDGHLDWLQGFRGATLEKLQGVSFTSRAGRIGDFLGEFKSVALTTSVPTTLLEFRFHTFWSWDPSYRSLLPFTQLKALQIGFICGNRCSSRLDDNTIIDLARAMPKLETLRLGDAPCETRGGVTVKGLIALARGCRHLRKLRIHFQTASLVEAATGTEVAVPSDGETVVPRQDCALTDLDVGKIPLSQGTALKVIMALLQIFPRLINIEFIEKKWGDAVEIIRVIKRISTFVQHTSKEYFPCP
jgi:hypothetical protein